MQFRYLQSHAGNICSCDSCGSEAPLEWFSGLPGQRQRKLCEVCADTLIGRLTEIGASAPEEYHRREPLRIMAQVANHLLDKLTQRLHEQETAEILPPESDE